MEWEDLKQRRSVISQVFDERRKRYGDLAALAAGAHFIKKLVSFASS